ncbi:hypothetical protein [Bacillus sp. FJAT-45037]|uniref:hypothetical protein n=1 Tax=Bacillus sp. FJAT-45037 TaxID=2011007 RepID=UPI000C24D7C1|nr:hypothetical protein [Bacillus sp. FJAT-45037]
MNNYMSRDNQRFADVYDRIVLILQNYHETHFKSPSISEIAKMTGDSEEMVLESLEFGRDVHNSSRFLH